MREDVFAFIEAQFANGQNTVLAEPKRGFGIRQFPRSFRQLPQSREKPAFRPPVSNETAIQRERKDGLSFDLSRLLCGEHG
ncbi:hypothetical protein SDC9_97906 [bioreactor metagenome]|uniref:Uncharacterized protein n=1 Tax=bioreactor metagenome TaxID=1076179 RepID=A0A645ADA2_9ZZZZ